MAVNVWYHSTVPRLNQMGLQQQRCFFVQDIHLMSVLSQEGRLQLPVSSALFFFCANVFLSKACSAQLSASTGVSKTARRQSTLDPGHCLCEVH